MGTASLALSITTTGTIPVLLNFFKISIWSFSTSTSSFNHKLELQYSQQYIKELHIATPDENKRVIFLSGGNQQKIVVAKWLMSDSEVIILDEPTRGIDVGAKREIYELINDLARAGKAVIVISSDMEEVLGISDRIAVMHEGRIAGMVEKKDFSQQIISEYAIGGAKL